MAKTTLGFVPIVHIVAAVLSLVELGLTAYLVSVYAGTYYSGYYYNVAASPDRVNFMLFNSIWSLVILAYVGITPIYLRSFFHKTAALALEAITMIFWFAGAIALAVWVGLPYCYGNNFCQTLQAAVAFGFFLWAIFLVLVVLDAMEAMKSRRHAASKRRNNPKAYTGA
ncbi:hypothetical protein VP1G_03207 [Cytospora mali]|uniref:MARVEL domain-containing protein n=1 Tax=Cytospora mali TaxID=578113 RepID=A0A194UW27_CYTMA|nr:hypothetical protein VP1G_03207 [Valsa mali var. pyri (nom. inval.)]